MREHKVFAFSATSSPSYERLVNTCISRPTVLKFKSEYEQVNGVSPIVDPTVVCSETIELLYERVENDIVATYEK